MGRGRRVVMRIIIKATLVAAALSAGAARAQDFKPDPVDEAAARREGALTWYTSTPVAAAQHIAKTFEQKYGIKVELLRTGGQKGIRPFQQEAPARPTAGAGIAQFATSAGDRVAQ